MKRSYDCGAAKRKKREHVINELSKQKNSLDAFVSRTHVDHQNVVSVTANTDYNTDAEENSCHSLSSANVNAIVVDHFPQAGTPSPPSGYGMTSPFLLVGEYEITDTYATKSEFFFDVNKQTRGSNNNDEEILYRSEDHEINNNAFSETEIVYPEDVGQWPDDITEKLREQFLTQKPKEVDIEMSKSMHVTQVRDRDRRYNRHFSERNFYLQKSNGTREKRVWLSYSQTTGKIYCYICKLFSTKKTQLTI